MTPRQLLMMGTALGNKIKQQVEIQARLMGAKIPEDEEDGYVEDEEESHEGERVPEVDLMATLARHTAELKKGQGTGAKTNG